MTQDYSEARLLRQQEPYHFQRKRSTIHSSYPRPPQPAYQPNQKPPPQGWGMSTQTYWGEVFSEYLRRRKSTTGGLK